jgi:phenylalanyl-tRNA synthetase alpha chain
MTDAGGSIEAGLSALSERYRERFAAALDEQTLRGARADVLGKKGELTGLLRGMKDVAPERRKEVGEQVNRVRGEIEQMFTGRLEELREQLLQVELCARPYDLSLPGRLPTGRGHQHPITKVRYEILDIFAALGFEAVSGPEVELEVNNFTKLAFPPDHPATDMQDTFWVDVEGGDEKRRPLLRTHTSNVQVREMSTRQPPMAVVSGGAVYRRDDDVTHSPMFHQIEGFLVDEKVTFAELKGVLTAFAQRLYGSDTRVRFRPSYFPFVEPGAELDVSCVFCNPDDGSRASCRVCKTSGWLEILGCGMIHPEVFQHCGIDPEKYTGFAFGLGIERVAMLRYGIPDIRVLFENDPRFLAQF